MLYVLHVIFYILIMPLYTIVLFVVIKMVCNYIRTTNRGANGNWTIQNMSLAVSRRCYFKKSSDQFPINNVRFCFIFSMEV